MSNIKVSIIVPVYNTEKYLRDCLDSLVNQTLSDIEIVVVNDGSKDSSPDIISEYVSAYPDKFVYASQSNSGQAVARNNALKMCTGDYIGFLDSDDVAKPTMFEKMYDAAIATSSDLVVCDYEYITNTKSITKHVKTFSNQKDMFIDCFVDPWNKLYKSDVLKSNDVTFPEGYFYEDTGWFIMSIPFVKSHAKVDEPLVEHYKRKDSSMTALDDNRVQHIFPVLEQVLDFYKGKDLYHGYKNELEYFCSKILLCSSFRRISRVKDRKIRKTLVLRSFEFLRLNFPEYKSNPYYHNKSVGIYIKLLSVYTGGLVLLLYKCLNFVKEWRER